ncbi:unnamed protein product, partial [Prorocentrum cordatum]
VVLSWTMVDLAEIEKAAPADAQMPDLKRKLAGIKERFAGGRPEGTASGSGARDQVPGTGATKRRKLSDVLAERAVATSARAEKPAGARDPKDKESITIDGLARIIRRRVIADSDESGEDEGGPGNGRPRHVDILKTRRKSAGQLSEDTLQRMARLLGTLAASDFSDAACRAIVQAYVHQIMFNEFPRQKIGLRNSREIETLALAADHLLRGGQAVALDVVMQRLKALERSLVDENWTVARWRELMPTGGAQLASRAEATAALKLEESERKLRGPRT